MNNIEIVPVPSITDQLDSAIEQVNLAVQQVAQPVVRGKTIDREGVVRGLRDEAGAVKAGFAPKPPIYALGTMVVEEGVRRFKESRRAFESLPLAVEACENLIETIKAEDRLDKVMDLPNLRANDDGTLHHAGNGTYVPSERAITGLCSFATPGGPGYLIECPNHLRATNLNHWLPLAMREDKVATRQEKKAGNIAEDEVLLVPIQVKVRTRRIEGSEAREAYAVVGPSYGAHDIDLIAQQVVKALPAGDARCTVTYDGFRARLDLMWHSNVLAEKVVAGEIFQAGMRIVTADDGTGSIKTSATVYRNRCLNMMIIDRAKQDISRRSHRGNAESIANDVEQGIQTAMAKMSYFAEVWNSANMEDMLDKVSLAHTEVDILKLFQGICFSKLVYVPGNNYSKMADRMKKAWDKEPGWTRAAVINAMTRAAHENEWSSMWISDEIEAQASNLLFKKDWNLRFPETEDELAMQVVSV